jgi:hypothetical protein
MVLKIYFSFQLILSLLFSDSIIYRAENKVTLMASDKAEVGKEYLFEGQSYLIVDDKLVREYVKSNADLSRVITSKVKDMSFLFYQSQLSDPKIESWDVSNVKTVSWMFGYATEINPNLSYWDMGSVVDFSDMFHGTKKFNGDISKWNTSSGELFNGMFFESNFNSPINDWDVSKAKNLSGMFDDAQFFNQPLDKWNTSNAEDMGGMFAEAFAFNQDISMWDVSKVENMLNMFRNALSFEQDLSNWDVPLITQMPEFFDSNSPLTAPQWGGKNDADFNWYYLLSLLLLIPLFVYLYKVKKNKQEIITGSSEPKTVPESEIFESLKAFLIQKNTNLISKGELDEILGAGTKSVEAQKKIRSNFIREFNASGLGEIYRVRDESDSRSFIYEVKWK